MIALTNQKGGVGKTTTAVNLGVSLAQQDKKVLLIDADAQANLTMSLGYNRPDDLPVTLSTIMQDIINDKSVDVAQGILHHGEGVDLLPSNIELSGLEVRLINAISRESVLKTCVNEVKKNYDYVLVDCMPSLGMLTINALAAADSVVEGGVYQMNGLRYGKYLVREKTAPTGFVLDENVYPVSIEENGKTYTVENKAGVGFINTAQKGSLKIVKTSSDGKVEGFSFRVTGVNYDQTFTTDKNGEILIENLRIGEYTVSEVNDRASAGYILPTDKQATVQVGATTIVQMHNELRDTPKTGDDFNAALWVSLAAVLTVGAGVVGFLGIKGKKKKED